MNKNKKLWATIGTRLVSSISYYNNFEFSEEEIYDLIANEEYLLDDSKEIYGQKLLDFIKIWEVIKEKIIEAKENYKEKFEHKWAFSIADYKKIYLFLDDSGQYEQIFNADQFDKSRNLEMLNFFEQKIIKEASLESFLEDVLITFIYFAIAKPLGHYTIIFMHLISNAMILYKGFGPIFLFNKCQKIAFTKQVDELVLECKNLSIEHYSKSQIFKSSFTKLLNISEINKLILDCLL